MYLKAYRLVGIVLTEDGLSLVPIIQLIIVLGWDTHICRKKKRQRGIWIDTVKPIAEIALMVDLVSGAVKYVKVAIPAISPTHKFRFGQSLAPESILIPSLHRFHAFGLFKSSRNLVGM